MPGLTVLPPPQTPGDLVIRVANDPIWPVPRKEGSAAWEKANLHKALGLATALQGTGARVVYYGTADSSVAAYAPGVAVETVPLIEGGIAEHPEWDARSREDAYYGAFYEAVAREGAHAAIVGGDEQSFREVPALALALPSTRFFCHNHGLGPSPDKPRAYERCNGVVHFVAISHAQVREYPTIQHAGVVYNALHPDEFRLQPEPVDCQIDARRQTAASPRRLRALRRPHEPREGPRPRGRNCPRGRTPSGAGGTARPARMGPQLLPRRSGRVHRWRPRGLPGRARP